MLDKAKRKQKIEIEIYIIFLHHPFKTSFFDPFIEKNSINYKEKFIRIFAPCYKNLKFVKISMKLRSK